MFEFLTNYKIMIPIVICILLAVGIYLYFFRKPAGASLAEVKQLTHSIQEELRCERPPPPQLKRVYPTDPSEQESEKAQGQAQEHQIPEEDQSDESDDNMTRESLYEEILKLNLLKNPVDFIFTAGRFEARNKAAAAIAPDNATIEGLENHEEEAASEAQDVLSALTEDYPLSTEEFGQIADKINEDMHMLDELNARDIKETIVKTVAQVPAETSGGVGQAETLEKKKKVITIKKK